MYKTLPIALLLLFTACSENTPEVSSQDGEIGSAISANDQTEEEMRAELVEIQKEEEERLANLQALSTTLEFDKLKHDFGNVRPETDNTTVFTVTNTGDKPLIIEDVSASCGCTTPVKPEGPIAPGASDVIEVTFHPKPGQLNEIRKTVTVTANTMDKVHQLEIRAFVK